MRILIVEDEPIIAIDLEDIVLSKIDADVVHAASVTEALKRCDQAIDFALLDLCVGAEGQTSLPVAERLLERNVPFCFISSNLDRLPPVFRQVPQVNKPFQISDVARHVPAGL